MFKDKVILITGASSGIGAALARRFARDAAHLVLVARRADRLAALAEELRGLGGRIQSITADLVVVGAVDHVLADAHQSMGRIDVLVNNAGIGEYGEFRTQSIESLEQMMHLNMGAVIRLTRGVLPEMVSRGSGRILNIASSAAFQPTPFMAVYGASKAFVRNFSMSLWWELRRTGVEVTCVCPGPVRTEFLDRGGYEARREAFGRVAAQADWVAEKTYRALSSGRPLVVPGALNALGAFLTRFGSLKMATRVAAKLLGTK